MFKLELHNCKRGYDGLRFRLVQQILIIFCIYSDSYYLLFFFALDTKHYDYDYYYFFLFLVIFLLTSLN